MKTKTTLPRDVGMDMKLSTGTIAAARSLIARQTDFASPAAIAEKMGALEARCEILADQLERAHAALAERAV